MSKPDGTCMIEPHHWTAREVQLLRDLYPKTRADKIAVQLGITRPQVTTKANKLKLRRHVPIDEHLVREYHQEGWPARMIARKLGRHHQSILRILKQLRLRIRYPHNVGFARWRHYRRRVEALGRWPGCDATGPEARVLDALEILGEATVKAMAKQLGFKEPANRPRASLLKRGLLAFTILPVVGTPKLWRLAGAAAEVAARRKCEGDLR